MSNNKKRLAKKDRLARIEKARKSNEPKKVRVKKTKPTTKRPLDQYQLVKKKERIEKEIEKLEYRLKRLGKGKVVKGRKIRKQIKDLKVILRGLNE